jgi:hypothetical protein
MNFNVKGARILSGATMVLGGLLTTVGAESAANADTVCSTDTATSFACADTAQPGASATGSFSQGATFTSGDLASLQISSDGPLDVSLNGQINTTSASSNASTSVVSLTASGPLHYFATGLTQASTGRFNTHLRSGQSIVANTGEIVLTDGGRLATGVYSEALNGDNTLTATNTIVNGASARGLWVDAFSGHSLVNTGNVTVTGYDSRGITVRALPQEGYCSAPSNDLSATVNVNGDVTAEYVGVLTLTCGTSAINVAAGKTISVSADYSKAIYSIGVVSSTTDILGSVIATSPTGYALVVIDGPSATHLGAGGVVHGRIAGDAWSDGIGIDAGGTWTTFGDNDFGAGNDEISNAGRIEANATSFWNLEAFRNQGVLAISGGSFSIPDSVEFTNSGTISVSPGQTSIVSGAALQNSGIIDLQNNEAGDTLILNAAYQAAPGATLRLDVNDVSSDRLVLTEPATGITSVFVSTSVLFSKPKLIVDTVASEPGAFVLGSSSATPLIDLNMSQEGDDYYVTAIPSSNALQPLRVGMAARSLWYQSAEAVFGQSKRGVPKRGARTPLNLWVEGSNHAVSTLATAGQVAMRQDASATQYGGLQAGLSYSLGDHSLVGVTMGYMPSVIDSVADTHGIKTTNSNFGAYARFASDSGFHAGIIAKFERDAIRMTHPAFARAEGNPDTSTFGFEAEAGTRTAFLGGHLDSGAGFAYVRSDVRSFATEGLNFKLSPGHSIRGRIGLRFQSGKEGGFFAGANLYHEFAGDEELRLTSSGGNASTRVDGAATSGRFELGFGGREQTAAALSTWLELGRVKGLGFNLGVRL